MNIIVTGGSNGIGKQAALQLAADKNNKILITGRDPATLEAVANLAVNRNVGILACDFNKLNLASDAFRKDVLAVLDSIDILINNAGILYAQQFMEISQEQAREMMEVNFFAPALIIRTLLPVMNKGAHIVNISSMGGFQGSVKFAGLSYYSASKAALTCLSECLAKELEEQGLTVNCLALGSVQTEMQKIAFPHFNAPVTAREIGKFISDFALNGKRYFNGKVIPVALTTP